MIDKWSSNTLKVIAISAILISLSQINLYKQATLCNPILLPLEKYGRYVENDRLLPIMKENPSKPAIAKLTFCKRKKSPRCLKNCSCAKAGVDCILACMCNGDDGIGGWRVGTDMMRDSSLRLNTLGLISHKIYLVTYSESYCSFTVNVWHNFTVHMCVRVNK